MMMLFDNAHCHSLTIFAYFLDMPAVNLDEYPYSELCHNRSGLIPCKYVVLIGNGSNIMVKVTAMSYEERLQLFRGECDYIPVGKQDEDICDFVLL
jgi:hypothetical protein